MAAKVVDASVLAALAFGEPRAEEAAARLEGAELHAPTLLEYELASVARRKITQAPHLRAAIGDALADALALDVIWLDVDHAAVVELALTTGLTTYDASYLYLARLLGAELITFDERLRAAASA